MNDTPTSPEAAANPPLLPSRPEVSIHPENSTPALSGAILKAGTPLLDGILSDAAGHPSSMRAVMLLGVGTVCVVWAAISLQTHTLQQLPNSVVGAIGFLIAGKFGQKFIEPTAPGNGVAGTSARPNGVGAREEISSNADGAQGEPATGRSVTAPHETKPEEEV